MSVKTWISWITLGLLIIIVISSRHELVKAWELLGQVNLLILALLIPMQLVAYYAAGETMFAYLRAKGSVGRISRPLQARMALEMNFVNHTLPSAGVSGISYMTWRLAQYKISPARATAAQVVRYVAGFAAAALLILISVVIVTIDGNINRWIILVSAAIVTFTLVGTLLIIFLISSTARLRNFSVWFPRTVNRFIRRITRGRKRVIVREETVLHYAEEMHSEYLSLRRDIRILYKPFLWALLFTLTDALLFWVTFLALGDLVNPAPIIIAYTLASVAGFIVVTPGGAGAYEAIMVAFLAIAGIASGTAIAGILLTRVIVLLTTIVLGYVFYQRALLRHGNNKPPIQR